MADHDPIGGEIRIGWKMGGLAFEVSAQVAAGALLGWGFDAWRGTAPTGMLVGSITGILVGLWSLIRGSLKLNRLLDQQYSTKGRGTPLPGGDDDDDDTGDDQPGHGTGPNN